MIEIIPAIDIIDGKCVRLTQGNYLCKKIYSDNPVNIAGSFEDIGLRRIHIVDLDGAKASSPVNLESLEKIVSSTSLDIEWGGGIKNRTALKNIFECGANRAICGSIAVNKPELFIEWLQEFNGEHIILGADVNGRMISVNGWREQTQIDLYDLIDRFVPYGLSQVICTDISKDGMLQGPSFELYDGLQSRYPDIDIIVSGGINSMQDVFELNAMKLRKVIVGKAIYEKKITLKEIEKWLQNE